MSKKKLLFYNTEDDVDKVGAEKKIAALDAWFRWLAGLVSLDEGYKKLSRLQQSSGKYLLKRNQFSPYCRHHELDVREQVTSR